MFSFLTNIVPNPPLVFLANPDKPCQSLKIWSDQDLTKELIEFGVLIYHQYNQDLIEGYAHASGCGFFNESSGLSLVNVDITCFLIKN